MTSVDVAIELALGRPFDVERTREGKYVVLWFNLDKPPPPVGSSAQEAKELFLDYWRTHCADHSEDSGKDPA